MAETILSGIHIYYYDNSNRSLVSKLLISVCLIGIWGVLENKYKGRGKRIKKLKELKELHLKGNIEVYKIEANRIIEFIEKKDEGTLYLIEQSNKECFYIWDDQYLIPESTKFPNDAFEIFKDELFVSAISRKVRGTVLFPKRFSSI